eukprot:m.15035 g.15035  ORF g.15035 m.15035 type:complete len:73 (+) comp4862_c1_seq1:1-219(+)
MGAMGGLLDGDKGDMGMAKNEKESSKPSHPQKSTNSHPPHPPIGQGKLSEEDLAIAAEEISLQKQRRLDVQS